MKKRRKTNKTEILIDSVIEVAIEVVVTLVLYFIIVKNAWAAVFMIILFAAILFAAIKRAKNKRKSAFADKFAGENTFENFNESQNDVNFEDSHSI